MPSREICRISGAGWPSTISGRLEREVIAEYCADEETLDDLRGEGIDLGQGFHLGRPAPAEDLLPLGV